MSMVKRGARTTLVGLVAVAFGVGLTTGATAPAQAAKPPVTSVDPGDLAAGKTPGIAWIRDQTKLVQPKARRVTDLGRLAPSRLLHVQGGFLATTFHDGDTNRVYFISYAGKRRLVGDFMTTPDVVSADGRWLVLSSDRYATGYTPQQHLRVVRVSDGRTVATRTFPGRSQVMAAGEGRVLVRQSTGVTVSWDVAGRTVRVLSRTRGKGRPATTIAPPGSFGADMFVARSGNHDELRDLRHSRQRLWGTQAGEFVLSFSPDDKRVVTASELQGLNQEAPWEMADTMRVRDARTGKVLRVFHGNLGVNVADAPIWEDASTLLLHAAGEWVPLPDGEGVFATPRLVRCSVTRTSCDIASTTAPSGQPVIMQRKSN